jgi:hypothetical protein
MSPPTQPSRPVTVRLTRDEASCLRCGTIALLTAGMPHGLTEQDGTVTRSTIPVLLCPVCDTDKPSAAPLITYFNVHGQVDAGTIEECAALIQAWVDSIAVPPLDHAQLDEEIRAWHQGDL